MRATEFIAEARDINQLVETIVANLHTGNITIDVDDHSFVRTKQRHVSPRKIDYALRKMPEIQDKLTQIEVGQQCWIYAPELDISLGLRKESDPQLRFILKTVLANKPWDSHIPVIILE